MIPSLPDGVDVREAEWLLNEKYGGIASDAFHADCARLAAGEPVAYVIGFSTFLGCTIGLSLRPLIPRPETEHWTALAIRELGASFADRPIRCLDLFSGSGCIGIAVLKHVPNASVDFADIDPAAVEQIKINLDKNGIDPSRYHIYASDIFAGIPAGAVYDVILANPPYIAYEDKYTQVQRSVFDHEPHRALFAHDQGLALIARFLEHARACLAPHGRLWMEHDDAQVEAVTRLLEAGSFKESEFKKDQFGLWRWVEAGI